MFVKVLKHDAGTAQRNPGDKERDNASKEFRIEDTCNFVSPVTRFVCELLVNHFIRSLLKKRNRR